MSNYFGVQFTDVEQKRLDDWMATKDLTKYEGSIGGRFTYHITPTSLGNIIKVSDAMEQKDTIDITEYEGW